MGRSRELHESYHDKRGRFTSYNRAHTVTQSGERFKMIRKLEPISPPADSESSEDEPKPEASTEESLEVERSLRGLLAASPGWAPLHNVTEAVFGKAVPSKRKRHRNWKDIEDAERRGERRDPSSTSHKPDEWYDDEVYNDFEVLGEDQGGGGKKLSKVKKTFEPHMLVISKGSGGDFIVTMGDPRKSSSKLIARESAKEGIRWWVRDNVGGKYGRYSHDQVFDATKLKLSPPVYSQWYVDNVMG